MLSHDPHTSFRQEWLKYGAIGYIACVEGYFRLLFADLINAGHPYSQNVSNFKDLKISIDDLLAIHSKRVSLGEYIAHLLPLNGIFDINRCMSTLIGEDFISACKNRPAGPRNPKPIGELWPEMLPNVESLFQMRHLFSHELATKIAVQPRKITDYIGSAAGFISHTEEMIQERFLADA